MFEDTYTMWSEVRLTQAQAAEMLGVCERTFRRWVERYREEESEGGGVEALRDWFYVFAGKFVRARETLPSTRVL